MVQSFDRQHRVLLSTSNDQSSDDVDDLHPFRCLAVNCTWIY